MGTWVRCLRRILRRVLHQAVIHRSFKSVPSSRSASEGEFCRPSLGVCFPMPGIPPGGGVPFCLRAKRNQKRALNTHDRTHFAPEALRSDNYRESDQKLGRGLLHSAMQQRRRKHRDENDLGFRACRVDSHIKFVTVLMHRHLAKSRDAARATRSAVTYLL